VFILFKVNGGEMNERVKQALDETIKMARDCDDLKSQAALLMFRAVMVMDGEREAYEVLKPVAERLLGVEQSFPAEL
jgi:hypothetical protein